jgi:hypothetical protein
MFRPRSQPSTSRIRGQELHGSTNPLVFWVLWFVTVVLHAQLVATSHPVNHSTGKKLDSTDNMQIRPC